MPVTLILWAFLINVPSSEAKVKVQAKGDLKSLIYRQIDTLANKKDLTINEWLSFVNDLDNKCTEEQEDARKEIYCSTYYELYKTAELFSESKPTFDDCARASLTVMTFSNNDQTSKNLEKIITKLCPEK